MQNVNDVALVQIGLYFFLQKVLQLCCLLPHSIFTDAVCLAIHLDCWLLLASSLLHTALLRIAAIGFSILAVLATYAAVSIGCLLAAIPGGILTIPFKLMPIGLVMVPILNMHFPIGRKPVPIGMGEVPIMAAIPVEMGATCCQGWQVLEQQLKQLWLGAPA